MFFIFWVCIAYNQLLSTYLRERLFGFDFSNIDTLLQVLKISLLLENNFPALQSEWFQKKIEGNMFIVCYLTETTGAGGVKNNVS